MVQQEALLDREVQRYRLAALSSNTKAAYRVHRDSFLRFCAFFSYKPVPASSQTISRFVTFLARTLKPQSVRTYLAGVRLLHIELGFPNPIENCWLISSTLKGISHVKGVAPVQKLPITPDILRQIAQVLNMRDHFQACFWAACLVAFFTFFRKSTLVPKHCNKHDCSRELCRKDIIFNETGAVIRVKHTKTLQHFDRDLLVPLPIIQGNVLCPIAAVKTMLSNVLQDPSDPLFMYSVAGQKVALTHYTFSKALSVALNQIGLNSQQYSGHSFRRGGASFAAKCGIPINIIKTQGDWKSNAVECYLSTPLNVRIECVNTLRRSILKG